MCETGSFAEKDARIKRSERGAAFRRVSCKKLKAAVIKPLSVALKANSLSASKFDRPAWPMLATAINKKK
jgi:hypothetical protein